MLCRPAIVSYCLWHCTPTRTLQDCTNHAAQAPASACRCRRVSAYTQMTDAVAEAQVMVYQYPQLVHCTLHRRYKRFLADVDLSSSTSSSTSLSALTVPTATAVASAAVAASVDSNRITSTDAEPAKRRRRSPSCSSAAAPGACSAAVAVLAKAVVSPVIATTVVHCPNTGSMMGLLDTLPAAAACSVSTVATRKYKHTLEMIRIPSSATVVGAYSSSSRHGSSPTAQHTWVGVHSALANKLVKEMLTQRLLPQLGQYEYIQPEVKHNNSRFDFVLTRFDKQKVYVEVKSITMAIPCSEYTNVQGASLAPKITQKRRRAADAVGKEAAACDAAATAAAGSAAATEGLGPNIPADGMIALFPDAVSDRAQRHVLELTHLRSAGHEAVCVFVIQRSDCSCFAPAAHIDPGYAAAVKAAAAAGVKMIAVLFEPDPEHTCIWFRGCVPVLC